MLIDVLIQPLSRQRINRKCYKCNLLSDSIYNNHINSINSQSRLVEFWHCKKCYQGLSEYRSEISKVTSNSLKEKFATDSEYVNKIKVARNNYYNNSFENQRTWSKDEFIKRCVSVHDDKYDYSKIVYENSRTKVEIVCHNHGSFWTRPSHHIHYSNGCPECNKEKLTSIGENELAEWMKSVYSGSIIRSDRIVLDGLEIDIWLPDINIGVEYHGAYYHSFSNLESTYHKQYHSMKSSIAYKKGIKLFQFVDLDYTKKKDIAQSMLLNSFGMSQRIYARNCKIEVLDSKSSKKFFDDNHYHSGICSHLACGLLYNGELCCVISFNKTKNGFEIARFANKLNTTIVGGFSRLMVFSKKLLPRVVLSTYVDRSFTTGDNCYSKYGMIFDGITKPGYRYWKNNVLYHRMIFQKHKLQNKLEKFDECLTEAENMFQNGYRRLWDAGNLKYRIQL